MKERKYVDIEGMKERVVEQDRKRTEEFHAYLNGLTDKRIKEQKEMQSLAAKAVDSERGKAQKKRDVEIEAEKAKAVADIEDKYESQGVKSDRTKQRENAWKGMLKNMTGMDD